MVFIFSVDKFLMLSLNGIVLTQREDRFAENSLAKEEVEKKKKIVIKNLFPHFFKAEITYSYNLILSIFLN